MSRGSVVALRSALALLLLHVGSGLGFYPYPAANPQVDTNYGTVVGTTATSRSGRSFSSFRGIPFAKPPIGDLRFKAPEKPEKWDFPWDATKDGPICMQKNYLNAENPPVEGQEDCLYLNVYVPNYAGTCFQNLPVMFVIHFGGLITGKGTSDFLGPEYLMDKDVIVVTANYRLGVLGFLTTNDDVAPGNFGLKDQVAALRWVQENILYFGGNPKKVTIFGESAGGGSVHLHLLSPLSKGLFYQAISSSGAALDLWARPQNAAQVNVTALQAVLVGCDKYLGNSSAVIKCLKQVDAKELVDSSIKFKFFPTEPLLIYTTVTENKTEKNPDPFMVKDQFQQIQDGEFQKVPWLIGCAEDDGILRVSYFLRQESVRQQLNSNLTSILPQLLLLSVSAGPGEPSDALYKEIQDFYLKGSTVIDVNNSDDVQGLVDLYSDRAFQYGAYQSVMLHSFKGHDPIWFFKFGYRGQYTYGDYFAGTEENINFDWGTSHSDDLLYLFRSPGLFPDLSNANDLKMSQMWIERITNFVIDGSPQLDNKEGTAWNKIDLNGAMKNENLEILSVTGSFNDCPIKEEMQTGFNKDRMRFWSSKKLFENFDGLQ